MLRSHTPAPRSGRPARCAALPLSGICGRLRRASAVPSVLPLPSVLPAAQPAHHRQLLRRGGRRRERGEVADSLFQPAPPAGGTLAERGVERRAVTERTSCDGGRTEQTTTLEGVPDTVPGSLNDTRILCVAACSVRPVVRCRLWPRARGRSASCRALCTVSLGRAGAAVGYGRDVYTAQTAASTKLVCGW